MWRRICFSSPCGNSPDLWLIWRKSVCPISSLPLSGKAAFRICLNDCLALQGLQHEYCPFGGNEQQTMIWRLLFHGKSGNLRSPGTHHIIAYIVNIESMVHFRGKGKSIFVDAPTTEMVGIFMRNKLSRFLLREEHFQTVQIEEDTLLTMRSIMINNRNLFILC